MNKISFFKQVKMEYID